MWSIEIEEDVSHGVEKVYIGWCWRSGSVDGRSKFLSVRDEVLADSVKAR